MEKRNRILNILMNDILIGTLEKDMKGGLTFAYDQEWIKTPGARPVSLSLPLGSKKYTGEVVFNYFDNLLPDNQQIRARIQTKFKVETNRPFDLLAAIGRDCVGAIQITDANESDSTKKIEFKPLAEKEIAHIMRGYQSYPLGMTDAAGPFRISIAGAQEKSAFLYYKKRWNIPLAHTPTTHIFKLPIGFIHHQQMDLTDSCENEWLCSLIAEAFGLSVAKSEILCFEDMKVLVVERFDRLLSSDKTSIMRLPQEDMCQALGVSSNLKYQGDGGPGIKEILQLLRGSVNAEKDCDEFYRTQILFWLLAAIDGHAKNFSIFIEAEGRFRLTPLYDIMSAYPLMAKKQLQAQKVKMAMALKGKNNHYHWYNIQRRHFIEGAKAVNFPAERAEMILDEMLGLVGSVISQVSAKIPATFPKNISKPIFDGMLLMKNKLSVRMQQSVI